MRTSNASYTIVALIAAGLLGLGWTALTSVENAVAADFAAPSAGQKVVVTGTIEALEKNLLGGVTKVEIVSPEMGRFEIADTGKGQELKERVGEKVTVTAQRKNGEDGQQVLAVESYEVEEG